MMFSGQKGANRFSVFKWKWHGDSSLTAGLLNDVPPEIELSDYGYGRLPSPGSESPTGLLNGERLNAAPIADLDLFFERLYSYYCEKGLWCIIIKWMVELLSLGFTICFSAFFLLFVDWDGLRNAKCGMDAVESGIKPCDLAKEALHEHPLIPLTLSKAIIVGYLGLFSIYWIFCFLRFFTQLKDTLGIRHFYYNSLHVTDSEIQTMPWAAILEKVVQLQSSQQLCVVKDLSAHDVVMRLMRKENYLIGMLNKGVLAFPISSWVPGAGPTVRFGSDGVQHRLILTKTLEWTLNWCILQSMFDRNFCVRRVTTTATSLPLLLLSRKSQKQISNLYLSAMDIEKSSSKTAGKPIQCRAAIARIPGEPLVIEEIIVCPPNSHEVRIRIICTSLCQSDVTFWKLKDFPAVFPRILGHEAIGIVESVGDNVDGVAEGDTVIPHFLANCTECVDCRSKKSNLCSTFPFKVSPWMPRDQTSRFKDLKGETLHHFLSVSSFSEYTVVDIAHLVKVDPAAPPNKACLLSCGVSTGVGAAWRTAKVEAGSTVVIFGLGSIGLAVAEGARLCGATRIIGVDVNPEKFEIGKKFGVTEFVNSKNCGDKSVSQVIIEMTDGGADYCFECVGLTSLVQESYACCRQGWGKTIVLGVAKPGSQLSLSFYEVLHCGKILMGSLFGGLKAKSDIPILLKRYMDKELQLDAFVTHETKFEDINKAFDLLIEGKCLRCVIWMDK